jgi:hypothetical protein
MRRFALMAVALTVPDAAHACMENPVPEALIFETKPAPQSDAFLIKAQLVSPPSSEQLRIRVLEGPRDLVGRTIGLQPEQWTSCLTYGRHTGYAQVRRVRSGGRTIRLIGIAFSRSWWDSVTDILGAEPYRYAGDRVKPITF